MKRDEITACYLCGGPTAPSFYQIRAQHYVYNPDAVRRSAGMEMMMGNAMLAHIMGPNEDLATLIETTGPVNVCLQCSADLRVADLVEKGEKNDN